MKHQNLADLLQAIEKLRAEMIKADSSKFTDPKVVAISQKLDQLLNEYYEMIKERK